jgi:hypothetical protein
MAGENLLGLKFSLSIGKRSVQSKIAADILPQAAPKKFCNVFRDIHNAV